MDKGNDNEGNPSGSSCSSEIPTKPPILPSKYPLPKSAIASTVQNDLSDNASSCIDFFDMISADLDFLDQVAIAELPITSCFLLSSDMKPLSGLQIFEAADKLPKTSCHFIPSDKKQESYVSAEKQENYQENLMTIMDFVFRDMESSQLDAILDEITRAQATPT